MEMSNDIDRMMLYEHARKTAEATYVKDPLDADNLMRWAESLIQLSQFESTAESKQMLLDAEAKLEEALEINPQKHDAMWCLGNAYTTHAFIIPDVDEAKSYFQKATVYFQLAVEEDPNNDLYRRSLEVSSKAPELHADIHNSQLGFMGRASSSNSAKASSKKKQTSDFTYDVMGWICLGIGILTWLGFAQRNVPPPFPHRS